MNRATLSGRIAAVLQGEPSVNDVAAVIADVETELERLEREWDRARKLSLDPLAHDEVVTKARQDSTAVQFNLERLNVALGHLCAALQNAKAREEEARRQEFRVNVVAERDALAQELRERYPELAGGLADLLTRIKANNERVDVANRGGGQWIDPVETAARGVAQSGIHFLVTGVCLPPFDREAHAHSRMLWPLPVNQSYALPNHMAEASGMRGTEIRRVGEQVAARKQAEADAPRRRA